jgi:hypothetical protein
VRRAAKLDGAMCRSCMSKCHDFRWDISIE